MAINQIFASSGFPTSWFVFCEIIEIFKCGAMSGIFILEKVDAPAGRGMIVNELKTESAGFGNQFKTTDNFIGKGRESHIM